MNKEELRIKLENIEIPKEIKKEIVELIEENHLRYVLIGKYNKDRKVISGNDFIRIFEDIYKLRFILDVSSSDISEYTGIKKRALQLKMKSMGWERDRFEAQAIAKDRRDYAEIRMKSRQTLLDRSYKNEGSGVENYIRHTFNNLLEYKLLDCQVIVGLVNKSILSDFDLEIDIPAIIFKGGKIYKYAIEVNGTFWHKDEDRELRKQKLTEKLGYKYITLWVSSSLDNNVNKIKNQVIDLVNIIYNDINGKGKQGHF